MGGVFQYEVGVLLLQFTSWFVLEGGLSVGVRDTFLAISNEFAGVAPVLKDLEQFCSDLFIRGSVGAGSKESGHFSFDEACKGVVWV